jgi:hypothetical protein
LFDRIGNALVAADRDNVLARPEALYPILSHYGFSLNPSSADSDF